MKLTKGGKLEPPNICFLCETTPAIGSDVVDTERYFDGWPATLRGRRYVCQRCVEGMLKFFNFATDDEITRAVSGELEAQSIIRGIKLRLDELYTDMKQLTENPSVFKEAGRESLESESLVAQTGESPVEAEAPSGPRGSGKAKRVSKSTAA